MRYIGNKTKLLRFIPDRDSNKSNLAFADVVVAGGMGLPGMPGLPGFG